MRPITYVLSLLCLTSSIAACTATPDEEPAAESKDALSQTECNAIVGAALTKSKTACAAKVTGADASKSTREGLERGVTTALGAFVTKAQQGAPAIESSVKAALAECGAIGCSGDGSGASGGGELRTDLVKALCGVEQAFLQAACYVRHVPDIQASVVDFSSEVGNLKDAYAKMADQWFSLVTQEGSLRAEHAACSVYAGSDAQRVSLNTVCRASCNENDATNVGSLQTGHGGACSPAGYEEVKDDVGQVVECGAMKRPLRALGTVCECQEQRGCNQFAAVAGSSERGKPCTTSTGASGFKKVVWATGTASASLVCR